MRIGFTDTQIIVGCVTIIALCAGLGIVAYRWAHGKGLGE